MIIDVYKSYVRLQYVSNCCSWRRSRRRRRDDDDDIGRRSTSGCWIFWSPMYEVKTSNQAFTQASPPIFQPFPVQRTTALANHCADSPGYQRIFSLDFLVFLTRCGPFIGPNIRFWLGRILRGHAGMPIKTGASKSVSGSSDLQERNLRLLGRYNQCDPDWTTWLSPCLPQLI